MSIVVQVQTILNDVGVFWPTQNLFDAINEAQFHIFAETKWAITTAPVTLTSNVDIIPIPLPVIIPKWIEGTNALFAPPVIKRFFPSTQRNLETFLRIWRGQGPGQPQVFVLWDSMHFRVFPRPDGNGPGIGGTYPMNFFGIGFPAEITTTTQDVVGPLNYVQAIQNMSASILLEATRPDLADLYMQQADAQVLAFKRRLRNQQSHNIRILKPASTRYEVEQSGQVSEIPMYYPLES